MQLSREVFGRSSGDTGSSHLKALHPAGRVGKSLEHFRVPEAAHSPPSPSTGGNLGIRARMCLDSQQPLPVAMRLKGLKHVKD